MFQTLNTNLHSRIVHLFGLYR